jgi:hypothetical protein
MTGSEAVLGPLVVDPEGSHLELTSQHGCLFRPDGLHLWTPEADLQAAWLDVLGLTIIGPTMTGASGRLANLFARLAPTGSTRSAFITVELDLRLTRRVVDLEEGTPRRYPYPELDALEAAIAFLGKKRRLPLLGNPSAASDIVAQARRSRTVVTPLTWSKTRRNLAPLLQ